MVSLPADRKDIIWVLAGSLLVVVAALVAYDQLMILHFAAWRLYESTPSTDPVAQALRGPVTGWYRVATALLALVAGVVAVTNAIGGRWRALVALIGLTLVVAVGIEVTQALGQRTTPTSEVDQVSVVSVVWVVMLGIVPLLVSAFAGVGLLRDRTASS